MKLLDPLCKPVRLADVAIKTIKISRITLREGERYVIVLQSITVRGDSSLMIFSATIHSNVLTPFILPNSTCGLFKDEAQLANNVSTS
jgi:hypothetical protein